MVLSVLSLLVSSGGTFAQNNWQQHQQLQDTQLAGTSQTVAKLTRPLTPAEMKRDFTGKFIGFMEPNK